MGGRATRSWYYGRVEEGRGGCEALGQWLRFPSPLIKPDVRISRIRLSDWVHCKARGGGSRCKRLSWRTPRSPKICARENRRAPRLRILRRLARKRRA